MAFGQTINDAFSRYFTKSNSDTKIGICLSKNTVYFSKIRLLGSPIDAANEDGAPAGLPFELLDTQKIVCEASDIPLEVLEYALNQLPTAFFENCDVHFCIPSNLMETKLINLPDMTYTEAKMALENRLENPGDLFWDFVQLKPVEHDDATTQDNIFFELSAETGLQLIDAFDQLNIQLRAFCAEPMIFPDLLDLSQTNQAAEGDVYNILVYLKESTIDIYITQSKQLVFFRSVPLGFDECLKAVSRKINFNGQEMQITEKIAQEILIKHDLFSKSDNTELPLEYLFFLLRPVLEKIASVIKTTIAYYSKQHSEFKVNNVILHGDFQKIKNIDSYFANELKFNFNKLELPKVVMTVLGDPNPAEYNSYCMAFGATLQESPTINLLPAEYLKRKKTLVSLALTGGFVGLWVIILLVIGLKGQFDISRLNSKLSDTANTVKSLTSRKSQLTSKTKRPNQTQLAKLNTIKSTFKTRMDVETILYQLNLIDGPELYLTTINFRQGRVEMNGEALNTKISTELPKFIAKLNELTTLTDLTYEIHQSNRGLAAFKISGAFDQSVN